MQNQHYQSIPDEVIEQVNLKADEIKTLLAPYVVPLTAERRKGMLKLGDKSIGFVEKSVELAQLNPMIWPSYASMNGFILDLQDVIRLRGTLYKLQQLANSVDDTMMISGSEAYNTALVFYTSVKTAVKQNIQGAKAVYDELKKRFPGKLKNNDEQKPDAE